MAGISPMGWALRPLKNYANFSGRAPRAEFWWYCLFMFIAYLVMMFVMFGAAGGMASAASEPSVAMLGAFGVAGIFMLLFWLVLLIPTLAVQVRRLHDTGRTGWWLAGFYALYAVYFFATIGTAFSAMASGDTQGAGTMFAGLGVLGLVMMAYGVALLVFYCLPGTRGPNRYGEDPYGPDVEQVFA